MPQALCPCTLGLTPVRTASTLCWRSVALSHYVPLFCVACCLYILIFQILHTYTQTVCVEMRSQDLVLELYVDQAGFKIAAILLLAVRARMRDV